MHYSLKKTLTLTWDAQDTTESKRVDRHTTLSICTVLFFYPCPGLMYSGVSKDQQRPAKIDLPKIILKG